jgi:energy-coupling factor transport system permease protein
MLNQFQQIREAQSIRGHRFRGIRDLLPVLMPLLMGSLERAFQLAETMTARGFHQPLSFSLMTTANKLLFLIGIVLFFLGWQAHVFFPQGMLPSGLANGLLLGGGIFFVLPFWRAGRVQGHTRYRVETCRKVDGWLMLVLGLAVFGFWLMARGGTAGLDYSPYPTLS